MITIDDMKFIKGDKIVCLSNSNLGNSNPPLTIDKVYEVTEVLGRDLLRVINDNGYNVSYSISRFINIQEKRNVVINDVLDL